MRRFLLDTNIASYVIRGRSRSAQATMETYGPGQICISAISAAELHYDLQNVPADHPLSVRVRAFLLDFPPLPWDGQAPEVFAVIKRRLERLGTPLEDFDLMIAAHAISIDAVLVTNNTRHFERIGGQLLLEKWYRE